MLQNIKNSILLLIILLCTTKGYSQALTISGPAQVDAGGTYTYSVVGGTQSVYCWSGTGITPPCVGARGGELCNCPPSSAISFGSYSSITNVTLNVYNTSSNSGSLSISIIPVLNNNVSISPSTQTVNCGASGTTLSATQPSGGNGTYTYQWQSSTDNINWTVISGATSSTYTPSGLSTTTYFNIGVRSFDYIISSNTATVSVVVPTLTAGTLSNPSQSINYNTVPVSLNCTVASGGCVNQAYNYQWQSSPDQATWTNINGAVGQNFAPGSLTATTYYHRAVTNSGSTSYSGIATIIVYPLLQAGTLSPTNVAINNNTSPGQLTSTAASGGNGSYTYQWQSSPDNSAWSDISGATSLSYTPGNLTTSIFYHLKVTSNGVVMSTNSASITVYPPLQPGSISPASQTINYNTNAASLALSGVSGGNSVYSYQWQSSTDGSTWNNISGAISTSFNPVNLTAPSNYYRATVSSNGVTAYSASATVTVYPALQPGNVTPALQTINFKTNAASLSSSGISGGNGSYSCQWQSSTDGTNWANIAGATWASGTPVTGTPYVPTNLINSVNFFRLAVTSYGITAYSASATVNVNPQVFPGILNPASLTLTTNTTPGTLTANPATGGICNGSFSYQWQSSTDGINFTNISGATALSYTPGNLTAGIYYRRQVTCGTDIEYTNVCQIIIGTINTNLNYIRERDIIKPGITDTATANQLTNLSDAHQITQYFDGLGRPIQTVAKQMSPLLHDLVTMQVYDAFGREVTKYMPYASTTNDGNYKTDPTGEQNTFNTSQFSGEQFYYAEIAYEPSPLNRVSATYAPGNAWVGSNRAVSAQYLINTSSDSVKIWTIASLAGSLPVNTGQYGAGQLYKKVVIDEQGHQIIEYTDLLGHVVLKKAQSAGNPGTAHIGWLNTYYVYDTLQKLRFVLQPRAVELINTTAGNWSVSQGIADELCFRYEYDARNRMVISKVAGAGEVWMAYDSRDRLAVSQDSNLRVSHQWLFTKYDALNRPIITGFYTDNTHTSQTAMQNYLTTQNMALYETQVPGSNPPYTLINSFPVITDATKVTGYNYYDDYSYAYNLYGFNYEVFNGADNGHFFTASNTVYPYPQPLTQSTQTRGMLTGTFRQFLSYSSTSGIISTPFYDDRGRVIQTASYNIGKGLDVVTTQYDFSGHPLRTFLRDLFGSPVSQHHYVLTKMNYDAAGRLKNVWKNIDSAASDQLIDSVHYNELGQLSSKYLGNNLDSVVYDYNIRGWVTGINKAFVVGTANHYFGMELGYDKSASITGTTSYVAAQFNGNIAGTIWKSAGDGVNRKYDFTYDNVNRLTGAAFLQNPSGSIWNTTAMDFTVSNLSYDANGNILKMNQNGFKVGSPASPIDLLTYTYQANSNKLSQVADAANDSLSKLGDFHYKGTKQSFDYSYDGNGNLIVDKNKGMTITYNYLNLPQQINVAGKGTISYSYNTAGEKLQKQTVDSLSRHVTITKYAAGLTFQQTDTITNIGGGIDTVQYMALEEGRARWAFHKYTTGTTGYGWEYDFMEKDHLGNTRVLLTQQKDTAKYITTMEAAYRATENALFYNIPATNWPRGSVPFYPVDVSVTNPNDSVAKVNGSGQKIGPAIILKVMSGDKVDIATNYYYNSSSATTGQALSASDIINSLATGIVSLTGGLHGSLADLTGPSTPLAGALTSFITSKDGTPTGKPNAYLNYMLLDDQFNYDSSSSGAVQVGAAGTASGGVLQSPLGATGITMKKSGYLYIYVSNATPSWDVFFDNLSVKTYSGPMLEETHYYPFGLTMAGISDKALKTNYAENKYKYNAGTELQNKEFSDGTGLEMYETAFRMLDPQLGRFSQIDPIAGIYGSFSPYSYAINNPISMEDPTGLSPKNDRPPSDPMQGYYRNSLMDDIDQSNADTHQRIQQEFMNDQWAAENDNTFINKVSSFLYAKIGDNGEATASISSFQGDPSRIRIDYGYGIDDGSGSTLNSYVQGVSIFNSEANQGGYPDQVGNGQNNNGGGKPTLPEMRENPPNVPGYEPPKSGARKVRNPSGKGMGWLDKKGRVWVPDDHNGTHAPHWDVQDEKGGGYTTVYPIVSATVKAGVGTLILIGLWEGVKYTAAYLGAPETGGLSLSLLVLP